MLHLSGQIQINHDETAAGFQTASIKTEDVCGCIGQSLSSFPGKNVSGDNDSLLKGAAMVRNSALYFVCTALSVISGDMLEQGNKGEDLYLF